MRPSSADARHPLAAFHRPRSSSVVLTAGIAPAAPFAADRSWRCRARPAPGQRLLANPPAVLAAGLATLCVPVPVPVPGLRGPPAVEDGLRGEYSGLLMADCGMCVGLACVG